MNKKIPDVPRQWCCGQDCPIYINMLWRQGEGNHKHHQGLFGYFQSIWIGGDWYRLEGILTYQGLKPPQSPSIHMDWGRTEQALSEVANKQLCSLVDSSSGLWHTLSQATKPLVHRDPKKWYIYYICILIYELIDLMLNYLRKFYGISHEKNPSYAANKASKYNGWSWHNDRHRCYG
jgi:hypothetical protein